MIKLFRMRSGEDVIGDVESENQEYINSNTKKIKTERLYYFKM